MPSGGINGMALAFDMEQIKPQEKKQTVNHSREKNQHKQKGMTEETQWYEFWKQQYGAEIALTIEIVLNNSTMNFETYLFFTCSFIYKLDFMPSFL